MSSFYGHFSIKMDSKGRFRLPSSFRLGEEFILANNRYQNLPCLDVYPWKTWEKIEGDLEEKSHQDFWRFYLYSARALTRDPQSRLLIPSEMRNYAELTGQEIILVGVREKFEIWSTENWQKFYDLAFSGFDSVLSEVVLGRRD